MSQYHDARTSYEYVIAESVWAVEAVHRKDHASVTCLCSRSNKRSRLNGKRMANHSGLPVEERSYRHGWPGLSLPEQLHQAIVMCLASNPVWIPMHKEVDMAKGRTLSGGKSLQRPSAMLQVATGNRSMGVGLQAQAVGTEGCWDDSSGQRFVFLYRWRCIIVRRSAALLPTCLLAQLRSLAS